ncbi:hypothetical protein GQ53DRAFT_749469 [Thozetella sp. PMI_491]|nr:hypothetical protein GQ53DRAFT_749469 [Thozetella sp. PMI_491]
MAACKACQEPLVIEVDLENSDEITDTVPDDLELSCGCHFHWQCLLDESPQVAVSLKCPSCGAYLPTNQPGPSVTNAFLATPQGAAILARYSNEGGVEENLDILPTITEEAFLASNPEARPARAMHLMAAEGDIVGIVDLLRDAEQPQEEGDEPHMDAKQLLLWRDPLNRGRNIVHIAVQSRQEEVFWLALWLSSALSSQRFPEPAVQAAQALGLDRLPVSAIEDDVRFVQDERGAKPEDICHQAGSPWSNFVANGLFNIS